MFLQWAVPGALVPWYSLRLVNQLGFDEMTTAACCATQASSVLSSLLAGQVADRWLSAEKSMALCSVLSGVCLLLIASAREPISLFVLTLVFWMVTGPMLLLGTTIAFTHLTHPERQFGPVRMWGTVGWMAVVWVIGQWLEWSEWLVGSGASLDDAPRVGALVAFVVAGYTLTLPHTPPRPASGARWLAPLEALGLLRERSFAVYLICTLAACVTFPFSTQNLPLLLRELGIAEARVGLTLTLAQITEVFFLAVLPIPLRLLGTRRTMGLGLAAWLIALAVLALGGPTWLVVSSLGLHGLYITGYLIAGQVYINGQAEGDVRASVQGLFSFTNGLGLLIGNLLAGWLRRQTGGDLPATFAVAVCIVGASFVLFVFGFRADPLAPSARKE
jgi:MFS family permease